MGALVSHLGEWTWWWPLETYCLASAFISPPFKCSAEGETRLEISQQMCNIASTASQHLLSPLLTSLPPSHSVMYPSAYSFSLLLHLQQFRINAFTKIINDPKSIVFPFDYGLCERHGERTREIWEERRKIVTNEGVGAKGDLAERMEVGLRMTGLMKAGGCDKCAKGVHAAIEMLRVSYFPFVPLIRERTSS